ncbi:MAG TPA: GIY-YIG nuclease family protein [Pirellulales bacterium]
MLNPVTAEAEIDMPDFHQRPFSIRIFVPDGDPDGLRLVEKSNWTGVGVVFNRTNYKEVVGRLEFDKTGVYVLFGSEQDSILPTIYVGEGDPVKDRLNQHYSKKDFWDSAVFFVSKDNSLNKAHVKYLESKLLELARFAKQSKIDNAHPSWPPTLSEAETADVESFLLDMMSIFPLLGQGVIQENGQHLAFTQDQVFNSPSTAAGIILGRAANGRIEWKAKDGRTLKDIQSAATGMLEPDEN